jgi:3-oxoacyl-[acyl-carrier protein] reductase
MTAAAGKVALITGGGTGVGRATALQLAARGYHVAINYSRSRDEAESCAAAAREQGVRAVAIGCNVADDTQVRSMIDQCRREFGRLDVLVNNAATTHFIPHTELEQLSE